ncbi:MAG TPA: hypothetical protein VFR10_12530, partial [bacterium]|nr:hypothetical protein [bacterium]
MAITEHEIPASRKGIDPDSGPGYGDLASMTPETPLRAEWGERRKTDSVRTQMHYARRGVVT